MGTYKTKIVDNIICSKLVGELDAVLASEWIKKLEKQEAKTKTTYNRFHDVREINAVNLSFDNLWGIAQKRLETYENLEATISVFLVSTPLNYGISRMYQSLTDGTPVKIEVVYDIEEAANFLNVNKSLLENIKY